MLLKCNKHNNFLISLKFIQMPAAMARYGTAIAIQLVVTDLGVRVMTWACCDRITSKHK